MKRTIILIFIALTSVTPFAEMMQLEVIEKYETSDGSRYTVEVSLNSINEQKNHFYLQVAKKDRVLLMSDLNDESKIDARWEGSNINGSFSIPDKVFFKKAEALMPLGLKLKDIRFYKYGLIVSWMEWREVRNFIMKGLDENKFQLKSTDQSKRTSSGLNTTITNYWFQK
jgi:hypothetical protein